VSVAGAQCDWPPVYTELFPLGSDSTDYRLLTGDGVVTKKFNGREIVCVEPSLLVTLAREALRECSFFQRRSHNEQVAGILANPAASDNDRRVALALLRNVEVSALGQLPICQDTGTATIIAHKGQQVWTGVDDAAYLTQGVLETYKRENLRYSQVAALTMYEERNTGNNLPAQIEIYAGNGESYEFLFLAKGGGSANKTSLWQENKALLEPTKLEKFLVGKIRDLGTAACPPYHLAVVIGGTSPEACLRTVKLASARYLDSLPLGGGPHGEAFRDPDLEAKLMEASGALGIGAQFGGTSFVHDVRVIRLPRHAGSCPIGIGVSCSADRNVRARIDRDGVWLETLDHDPGSLIPEALRYAGAAGSVAIDLDRPITEILAELRKHSVSTPLSLTGTLIVARDAAHARFKQQLEDEGGLPDYLLHYPVYYAGPARTPAGKPAGSFGPTTSGRMDSYVELLMSYGASLLTIGKGDRSQQAIDACARYGGFYLGAIGGAAAILAEENIRTVECIDYEDLGMEAVWKLTVIGFPAFLIIDDRGNDFYRQMLGCCGSG
jgi:fumarate hydratase class I